MADQASSITPEVRQQMEASLRGAQVPDSAKAAAWNAFMLADQPEKFKASFDRIEGIPNPLKLQLAHIRFGIAPAVPPSPAKAEASPSNVGREDLKNALGPPPGPPKPPMPPLPWEMRMQQDLPPDHGPGLITGKDQTDIPQAILNKVQSGVGKVARGVEQMAEPDLRQQAAGVHDVVSGGVQVATPAMLGAAGAAPARFASTALAAGISQQAVEKGLTKLGIPKEYAAVAGDLAAIIVGAKTSGVVDAIDEATAGKAPSPAEIKAKVEPILKERMAAAGKPLRPPLKKPGATPGVAPPPTPPSTGHVELPPPPEPSAVPPKPAPKEQATSQDVQPTPPQEQPGPPPVASSASPITPEPEHAGPPKLSVPPPDKYAGGDAAFAGKVAKGRAMKESAAKKKSPLPEKRPAAPTDAPKLSTPPPAAKAAPAKPALPPEPQTAGATTPIHKALVKIFKAAIEDEVGKVKITLLRKDGKPIGDGDVFSVTTDPAMLAMLAEHLSDIPGVAGFRVEPQDIGFGPEDARDMMLPGGK